MRDLVSTEWLADHLQDGSVRIVDVRWYLDPARRGSDAYAAGHIPGSVFLDILPSPRTSRAARSPSFSPPKL